MVHTKTDVVLIRCGSVGSHVRTDIPAIVSSDGGNISASYFIATKLLE